MGAAPAGPAVGLALLGMMPGVRWPAAKSRNIGAGRMGATAPGGVLFTTMVGAGARGVVGPMGATGMW